MGMIYRTCAFMILAVSFAWLTACEQDNQGQEDNAQTKSAIATQATSEADITGASTAPPPNMPPNIILILADDLGWRDVGYHGSDIKTPHIDRLAKNGVIFNRFYTQPTCSPTRAALMTGRMPLRLGIVFAMSHNDHHGVPLDEHFLPQYLKQADYQNFMVGKWHLGFRKRAYAPTERGFDYFYGSVTGGIGHYDHVHAGGRDWQRNGETVKEEGYTTHLITNEAIELIEGRDKEKPMFLYVSFNAPHLPNEAPPATIARYKHIENQHRRVHAAMVEELDIAIGQMVDKLTKEGILENTLILFMSDNGGLSPEAWPPQQRTMFSLLEEWYGAPLPLEGLEFWRNSILDGGSDNAPLQRGKFSIYEGGVRAPAFIYWQGKLRAHQVKHMVTVQDILPTLMEAANLPLADFIDEAKPLDGRSQWQAIANKTNSQSPPLVADYITQAFEGTAFYRYPWKLMNFTDGRKALYNIENDPSETTNLAEREVAKFEEMTKALNAFPTANTFENMPSMRDFMKDPDTFGGVERRAPWTDLVED